MIRPGRLTHVALAGMLAACVSGCSAYQAFHKCGLGGCPDDAKITAEVRALYARHPVLEGPNVIDVQTVDRIVYLNGVADTDLERQMAETVALQAPGVRRVVNSIGLNNSR